MTGAPRGDRTRVALAFACIWFVWGSTFLAIRIALADLPPTLLCGVRLASAGLLLLAWAALTRQAWPRGREWWHALATGLMLPTLGNLSVTLGVTHVPSGVVALLLGTIPLWMAVFAALGPERITPRPLALTGLVLGFVGVVLIIAPNLLHAGRGEFDARWALIPVAGSASWAWGSLWSRRVRMPASPLIATAVGLTGGGLALLATGRLLGEHVRVPLASFAPSTVLAMAYLAVLGSVAGFSAYLYLLRRVSPAKVATYAFVNPVVALLLGAAFDHEALSLRSCLAAALVVVAVALITSAPADTPRWTRAGANG